MKSITRQEYTAYNEAYDYFNTHLFAGQLPSCLITLQRHRNAYGYFAPKRFVSRTEVQEMTDEIALNPNTFESCSDKDILGTLVHEMCHLWQAHFGKAGRRGYHNREWAKKMLGIGLQPISIDMPGKMTGQRVTHEIMANGVFARFADQLLDSGFHLTWESDPPEYVIRFGSIGSMGILMPPVSKLKYTCPICGLNSWAKPKVNLICGQCLQKYVEQATHLITTVEFSFMVARFGLRPCQ